MPTRKYVSTVRSAAAEEKRERVLSAASRLLREGRSISGVSVEAVAKSAGVTRLTVYNQFHSRRGLLEEVFDRIAGTGGLGRIAEAMSMTDPASAIERIVQIFCEFWDHDPAIGRLSEASGSDPEFAQAIDERNERRRKVLTVLVGRLVERQKVQKVRAREVVDLIFALTSYPMFALLRKPGRPASKVCAMIQQTCRLVLVENGGGSPD
jgi:AcrR family transcriptional regulator